MACYWGSNNTLPKNKHELGELGEPVELSELDVLGELANSKSQNLTKLSAQNIAYCRTACKTCKFRPLSDRPTVETDAQNRRCTSSIYIASFQIDFRFRTSKS